MRFVCAVVLVLGLAVPARAQSGGSEQGWSFSGGFNGSANSAGVVTKVQPVLGYTLNNHFQTYAGLPFYIVNISSTATSTGGGFMSGIGNALAGFRVTAPSDSVDFSSTLELTAPTGDKSRGFSTGHVTADWTNRFSHRVSSLTPFGSVGIANTISDTTFFVRPFTSYGMVGHFEGGSTYDVSPIVRVGGSAYAVRGAGQQTITSKLIHGASSAAPAGSSKGNSNANSNKNRVFETTAQTVGSSDVADDGGFSTWFAVSPNPQVSFQAGYSRSVSYEFNTFFFGIGFHVGK